MDVILGEILGCYTALPWGKSLAFAKPAKNKHCRYRNAGIDHILFTSAQKIGGCDADSHAQGGKGHTAYQLANLTILGIFFHGCCKKVGL
jgi:hypothetical protein